MKRVELKYKCLECGELHDYENDAYICCAPFPDKVYVCPECDFEHESESDAIECCGEEE